MYWLEWSVVICKRMMIKYLAKTNAALLAVHMSLAVNKLVSLTMASSKQSSLSIHIRQSASSAYKVNIK